MSRINKDNFREFAQKVISEGKASSTIFWSMIIGFYEEELTDYGVPEQQFVEAHESDVFVPISSNTLRSDRPSIIGYERGHVIRGTEAIPAIRYPGGVMVLGAENITETQEK